MAYPSQGPSGGFLADVSRVGQAGVLAAGGPEAIGWAGAIVVTDGDVRAHGEGGGVGLGVEAVAVDADSLAGGVLEGAR